MTKIYDFQEYRAHRESKRFEAIKELIKSGKIYHPTGLSLVARDKQVEMKIYALKDEQKMLNS